MFYLIKMYNFSWCWLKWFLFQARWPTASIKHWKGHLGRSQDTNRAGTRSTWGALSQTRDVLWALGPLSMCSDWLYPCMKTKALSFIGMEPVQPGVQMTGLHKNNTRSSAKKVHRAQLLLQPIQQGTETSFDAFPGRSLRHVNRRIKYLPPCYKPFCSVLVPLKAYICYSNWTSSILFI